MITDPLEQQERERVGLARRHPEAYNALIEQEQKKRENAAQNPDALDRLIERIKKFLRLKK